MNKSNQNSVPVSPPPRLLPILQKVKEAYTTWYDYHQSLPKLHRYTIGQRVDTLLIETIEAISSAAFLTASDKLPYIRLAMKKLDTLKIFLLILWETKSLDNKKYITLSLKIDEIGRMLGGWNGSILKQNSPNKAGEK